MLNNSKLQTFLAIGPLILLFICTIGYFGFIFSILGFSTQQGNNIEIMENSDVFPLTFAVGMGVFLALFFVTCAISIFSWIYFILHAAKNPNFDLVENQNMRLIWILILVLVSGLGTLVYWIVEIKSKNPRPIIPS
jgi:hypothetical protein